MAAFREWERVTGEPFGDLKTIHQPTLVVHGTRDEMIPVANRLPVGGEPSQRVAPRILRRGTRHPVPIPWIFHASGGGISRTRFSVRAVLRGCERCLRTDSFKPRHHPNFRKRRSRTQDLAKWSSEWWPRAFATPTSPSSLANGATGRTRRPLSRSGTRSLAGWKKSAPA
jgi:hypothetical protein